MCFFKWACKLKFIQAIALCHFQTQNEYTKKNRRLQQRIISIIFHLLSMLPKIFYRMFCFVHVSDFRLLPFG